MIHPSPQSAYKQHWSLDPEVYYLNHGSFGAAPSAVLEAQARHRAELERQPVQFMVTHLQDRIDAVRGAMGPFLNAAPEDLVFVPNATTGVNAVLRSMELSPGDELVITDHGYNACNNAVRFVADRAGAKVVVAELPFPVSSAGEMTERILAAVTPRTRLVLLDHITSPTALVMPLAEIVSALRERGIEALVDGAHALGMLNLDLDALGAAYYTGNCHKWMCTPKGSAVLHVRRDLQESVRPAIISHGANSPQPGRSRYLVEFDWCGTGDPTAMLSILDSLEFFRELLPRGWQDLREHNHALALAGREIVCEALGIEPPAPDDMIGSLVSLLLPAGQDDSPRGAFDDDPLKVQLYEQSRIEVPIMPLAGPGGRVVRLSAQLYNGTDDYHALAQALRAACCV